MIDGMAYSHVIDSGDLDLIGRWFTEKARRLISADARYNHPVMLHIWPSTSDEQKLMGDWAVTRRFTQDEILTLAEYLTRISADWPSEVPE
jgi:hypothetical protein